MVGEERGLVIYYKNLHIIEKMLDEYLVECRSIITFAQMCGGIVSLHEIIEPGICCATI